MPHGQDEEPYFIHGDTDSQERLESMQLWICKDFIFKNAIQTLGFDSLGNLKINIYKIAKQVIKSSVLASTLCCVTAYKFRGQTKEKFLGGKWIQTSWSL